MTEWLKPRRLLPGSRLAVVSPSGAAAAAHPDRMERGLDALRTVGYDVTEMPNARRVSGLTAGSRSERAADLVAAFSDARVDGIVCSIGGQGSVEVLSLLDYDSVRHDPKVFCGYSDVTALHTALNDRSGLVTIYGPAVMPDWAELPTPPVEMTAWFQHLTSSTRAVGLVPTPNWEVVEYVSWSADRQRRIAPAPPPRALRRGTAEGHLTGGCLPVLCELLEERLLPDPRGGVLFVEYPQEPYSPADAARDLSKLADAGVMDAVSAVVAGRPHLGLHRDDFERVLAEATRGPSNLPVLSGVACGHTLPNIALPLGTLVRVHDEHLEILEPVVVS